MNLAPVVLFVYNRPLHTEQTLFALKNNEIAIKSILYIYVDGPKENATQNDLNKIAQVKAIIKKQKWCKEVIITESITNKGLADSIIDGVTEIVNKHGKVIVLEDDIVASPFFLEFMNDALNLYEKENKVISIGAFNFFATNTLTPDTFFIPIPDCWGWATWKDRWALFEANGQKLLDKLRNSNLTDKFNLNGAYNFEQMLVDQIQGKNDSWAIRWQAVAYLHNKLTLYPKYSVTKNIGFDADATHGVENDYNRFIKFATKKISIQQELPLSKDFILSLLFEGYKKNSHYYSNVRFMTKLKNFIKYFIPPLFYLVVNKINRNAPINKSNHLWYGNFATWQDALGQSEGYDAPKILEKVKNATLKVKNGEAVYERDSVVFDKIQYSWPLLAYLLKISIENNNELNIIDFGGSLGSSYFQNRDSLKRLKKIKWKVVEQSHFVTIGNNEIANEQLHFYNTVEDILLESKPNVLLLSGVLQCIDKPYEWIEKFIKFNFEYIIIDRTAFIDSKEDRITIQNVPESIYKASYPAWFFNEDKFINSFTEHYTLISTFDNGFTPSITLEDGKKAYWKGFILKSRKHV